MDLQISLFLLFILFTAGTKTNNIYFQFCCIQIEVIDRYLSLSLSLFTKGHSLNCNVCLLGSCAQKTCSSGENCLSLLLSPNRMAQTGEYEQGLLNDSHRMVSSVLVEVDEGYEQSDDVFLI